MNKEVVAKIEKLFDLIAEVERIDGMWDTDPEPGDYLWVLMHDLRALQDANPRESAYVHYAQIQMRGGRFASAAQQAMSALEEGVDITDARDQFMSAVRR